MRLLNGLDHEKTSDHNQGGDSNVVGDAQRSAMLAQVASAQG
jgi:hypothetical protein